MDRKQDGQGTGQSGNTDQRGRQAAHPHEIPAAGWLDIGKRVMRSQTEDNLSIVSAGVAFYVLLALFPALAAAVSIYALAADPHDIQDHLQALEGIIPAQAREILSGQVERMAEGAGGGLGLAVAISIAIALWSSSQGVKALMMSLNIVYNEEETRGYLHYYGLALLLTLALIIGGIIALTLVAVFPALVGQLGLGDTLQTILSLLRWPLLGLGVIVALAAIYRLAPSRHQPRWQWVSWGSVLATVLWLLASILFSIYIANFDDYNETYGSLGAAIILMTWLYISAYVILLGGELNAEMEHQTRRDTTSGEDQVMGERGANVANTVGKTRMSSRDPDGSWNAWH